MKRHSIQALAVLAQRLRAKLSNLISRSSVAAAWQTNLRRVDKQKAAPPSGAHQPEVGLTITAS